MLPYIGASVAWEYRMTWFVRRQNDEKRLARIGKILKIKTRRIFIISDFFIYL